MAQTVVMPKMGQTQEDVKLVKWHKRVGDSVKTGEIIFEVETEKAVLEVESFYDGTLLKILVGEGETAPIATPVAFIGAKGEKVEAPQRIEEKPHAAAGETDVVPDLAKVPAAPVEATPERATGRHEKAAVKPGRIHISPRAKSLARESCVDPSNLKGTGTDGRIVEKDVEAYLEAAGYFRLNISPAAKNLAMRESIDLLSVKARTGSERISVRDVERAIEEKPKPMSKMRQVIARRLTESFTTTPHFYITVSADLSDLLSLRKKLKDKGAVWSVTDFVVKAAILSLQECPAMNCSTDGAAIRRYSRVDLGLAVAIDEGLVVPVIRDAGGLTMRELHDATESLGARARDRKLAPDEMTGSTFTLSNMGMLNVENFAAIINPGEAAILAVSSAMETPVAMNGKVRVRTVMKMTLSADHRIVDGRTAAAFLNAVKNRLEDVKLWKSLMS